MIIWCVLLAVVSALLLTQPPQARQVALRLGAEEGEPSVAAPVRRWRWPATLLGATLSLAVAHRLGGPAAVAVGAAVLIMVATCLRLVLQDLRLRKAARARVQVAHACNVLASQIRVGRVPAEALASAVEDCPVLADAGRTQELGGDVTAVWRLGSAQPGQAGLADLARAWQVSTETGAPMAAGLDRVSDALTADLALRTVIAGELAAPRASGKIMAVLPFCGLGMGYLLGGDPVEFLIAGPFGWGCLVLGVALAAAGVLWIDRLSRLAADGV